MTGAETEPARQILGDFRIQKLVKTVAGGKGEMKYQQDSVKCMLHIRSEVKLDTL